MLRTLWSNKYMRTTNTRTDLDMAIGGSWAKAGKVGGKQSWRHENGTVVSFDCMAWGWRINDERGAFKTLWAARWHVERNA
jgi:hypothetical protein